MIDTNGTRFDTVVQIRNVTRWFGRTTALDDVSLDVPRGAVLGLVGVNGAGKTTLIKHLLGLLKAQTGSVRVLGLDPVADPVGVLSHVGYLGEENDLPGWMRVDELLTYTEAFYPSWDRGYAGKLRDMFELDPTAKVKNLSKGQRARTGLLVALAYRPDILVLDEPSSGLDPIVRRDILTAVIRTISEQGRTVLFSSHLLEEVERISDHIALIDKGRIVLEGPLDEIVEGHPLLTVRFDTPRTTAPTIPEGLGWTGAGHEWSAVCANGIEAFGQAVLEAGGQVVDQRAPSLSQLFIARVGKPCTVPTNGIA
ncbi:MAG: ABC transporter ATP-binding protein [Pirellulales bacterium]|nr:ABC transporter ATP-binding protein [Pirellulales bacterium]